MDVKLMHRQGASIREIARRTGLSRVTVRRILGPGRAQAVRSAQAPAGQAGALRGLSRDGAGLTPRGARDRVVRGGRGQGVRRSVRDRETLGSAAAARGECPPAGVRPLRVAARHRRTTGLEGTGAGALAAPVRPRRLDQPSAAGSDRLPAGGEPRPQGTARWTAAPGRRRGVPPWVSASCCSTAIANTTRRSAGASSRAVASHCDCSRARPT
ncbi:MAG: helix-turn-helix domain-containing protein [Acidobacteria bacterium]|nr:helix-turn-helix domain-containing protein [Acidobacteriota bacterium]